MNNINGLEEKFQSMLDIYYHVGRIIETKNTKTPNELGMIGTWSRIEGRFLFGSNPSAGYNLGNKGGSAMVTLNINQIPSHNHQNAEHTHDMYHNHTQTGHFHSPAGYGGGFFAMGGTASTAFLATGSSGYFGGAKGTSQHTDIVSPPISYSRLNTGLATDTSITHTGGSTAHDNMPPWEVVNIWERTA
jgi:microcystin-dependent protein